MKRYISPQSKSYGYKIENATLGYPPRPISGLPTFFLHQEEGSLINSTLGGLSLKPRCVFSSMFVIRWACPSSQAAAYAISTRPTDSAPSETPPPLPPGCPTPQNAATCSRVTQKAPTCNRVAFSHPRPHHPRRDACSPAPSLRLPQFPQFPGQLRREHDKNNIFRSFRVARLFYCPQCATSKLRNTQERCHRQEKLDTTIFRIRNMSRSRDRKEGQQETGINCPHKRASQHTELNKLC